MLTQIRAVHKPTDTVVHLVHELEADDPSEYSMSDTSVWLVQDEVGQIHSVRGRDLERQFGPSGDYVRD